MAHVTIKNTSDCAVDEDEDASGAKTPLLDATDEIRKPNSPRGTKARPRMAAG